MGNAWDAVAYPGWSPSRYFYPYLFPPEIEWGPRGQESWGPPLVAQSFDRWIVHYRCPICGEAWEVYVALEETQTELYCHRDGTRVTVPLPLPS